MIFADNSAPVPNQELGRLTNARANLLRSPNTRAGLELYATEIKKSTLSKFPKLQDAYGSFIALAEADMVSQKNGLDIFSKSIDQQATVRAIADNISLLINGVTGRGVETVDPVYEGFLRSFIQECRGLEKPIGEGYARMDVIEDLVNIFKRSVRGNLAGAEDFSLNRQHINGTISAGIPIVGEKGDEEYVAYVEKLKAL